MSPITIGAEQPLNGSSRHHTRTRKGCERCRAQRRKCDEEKPRCKRCTGSGATCKYVTHVSFKTMNPQTLPQDVGADSTKAATPAGGYQTIEFILDDGPDRTSHQGPLSHPPDTKQRSNPDPPTEASQNLPGLGWPLVGQSPLSSVEIELLKYYSRRVSPWLDVYDQCQTFSRDITRLAMNSPCVLEALLQVSAVASGCPVETVTRRGAGMFHLQAMSNPPGVDSPSSALRMIACFVLARTLLFVDVIPDSWERTFQGTGAFLYFRRFTFADTVERRVWLSFLTLVTRLEVAYGLMNQLAPNWISGLAHQIQEQSEMSNTRDNIPQRILDTSIRCLRLLIDAMNISFTVPEASDDATAPPGEFDPSHFNQRNELMDRLDAWQRSRPPDLKPLIEVDHPKGNLPTIIFTNGAGISANIIYHTAMALLLRNKQDSTSTDEHGEALEMVGPQESPDWHAQRVCGIAINSEPKHARCWDPIMIAAFWLATQGLNLRSQQDQVLVCLGQLKAAGWHIDILINKLHEKWGHAN